MLTIRSLARESATLSAAIPAPTAWIEDSLRRPLRQPQDSKCPRQSGEHRHWRPGSRRTTPDPSATAPHASRGTGAGGDRIGRIL